MLFSYCFQLPPPKNTSIPSSFGNLASLKSKVLNHFLPSRFKLDSLARWLGTATIPESQRHGLLCGCESPKVSMDHLVCSGLRRCPSWGHIGGVFAGPVQELRGSTGAEPQSRGLAHSLFSFLSLSPAQPLPSFIYSLSLSLFL